MRTGSCTNTAHEDSDRRRLSESSSTVDVIAATSATEMQANKLYLSHCKPDSWVDFAIRVGDTNSSVDPESSNIIFEVLVNQASKTNPTALSMYLHLDGHLPDQRDDTEIFSTTATNGILSVSVPAGLVASKTSALFLSVRCGDSAVRFKTVALVLKSDMVAEEHNLGEVCPNNWVRRNVSPFRFRRVDHSFELFLSADSHCLVFTRCACCALYRFTIIFLVKKAMLPTCAST